MRAHRRLRVVIAMFLYAAMPMLAGLSGFWLVLTMLDQVALAIGVGLLGGFAAGLGLWALIIPHSGLTTPGEDSDIMSGAPYVSFRDSSLGRWLARRWNGRSRDGEDSTR